MSKMPMKWHKECLCNSLTHLNNEKEKLIQQQNNVKRLQDNWNFYFHQYLTAEKQKKDGFDSEKFLKKERQK